MLDGSMIINNKGSFLFLLSLLSMGWMTSHQVLLNPAKYIYYVNWNLMYAYKEIDALPVYARKIWAFGFN